MSNKRQKDQYEERKHRQKEQRDQNRDHPADRTHPGLATELALWGHRIRHIRTFSARYKERVGSDRPRLGPRLA